ncbi:MULTISPECIES: glycosyltransferase family 1 protein [unclassified Prevotella]|uniref:glycosyltransferase family 4 protein n=1 Tax=unclassified Prevotella TaxID=2638335 RepID=UPI00048FF7B6|nr:MULTISPECIES: glycosyltransferase family 1 protein [unclassified Prevotella]
MKTIGINLIPLFSEQGSGAFRYIKLLLQELGNYKLLDSKLIVYKQQCISKEYIGIPESLNVEFVDVPNVGRGFKRILFEQTKFYKYIKPCDVFYSYCSSMPFFLRSKKIFTLHDVYFLTEKERYGFVQRNYLKLITALYLKLCDKVLTVSEYSKREIIRHFHVKPENITITYNFLNSEKRADSLERPLLSGIGGEEIDLNMPFFLYVGNIHPGKNIVRMVEGFRIFNQNSDIKYNLLISGKLANSGEEIIERINGNNNVHYLGYQSRENVEWMMQNCQAVVLLSLCEGFGIPPLEGFAYNKPALVSNTTSLPEVVGAAGVCVNPLDEDEIAGGFKRIEKQKVELSHHCWAQINKFSAQESVETFMKELGIEYKKKRE